ncbi:MAG: phosphatase PAP2 family protein [Eubacteriales bacterium]
MLEFMVKLQDFRTPLLNKIAEFITMSGEELILIIVMCIVFWCISREKGYKLLLSIVFASAFNDVLKQTFNVKRPWVRDERIIPLRVETATGSSFPSGHTQVGGSMWLSISRSFRKPAVVIICYAMIVLLAFSRVYLGVHTPWDVIASLVLCIIGVLFAHYIMERALEKNSAVPLIFVAAVSFLGLFFFKEASYYKMTGILLALPLGFFLENKYIKFDAKGKFLKQILKIIVGFAIVLLFKEGLKLVLPDSLIFQTIRYFFVGIGAIYIVPLIYVKTKLSNSLI